MQHKQKSQEIEDPLGKLSNMHVHWSTAVCGRKYTNNTKCSTLQHVTHVTACYTLNSMLHGQRICSDGQCGLAPVLGKTFASDLQSLTQSRISKCHSNEISRIEANYAHYTQVGWRCADKIKMWERHLCWHFHCGTSCFPSTTCRAFSTEFVQLDI